MFSSGFYFIASNVVIFWKKKSAKICKVHLFGSVEYSHLTRIVSRKIFNSFTTCVVYFYLLLIFLVANLQHRHLQYLKHIIGIIRNNIWHKKIKFESFWTFFLNYHFEYRSFESSFWALKSKIEHCTYP